MVLETERLSLRQLTQNDFAALCRILQDADVMYAYAHAFSNEEVQEWLDRQLARYAEDGFGLWGVIEKDSGELIGQCGLTMQDWEGRKVPEIGYLFQKASWHQGYAAEAATACRRYAFETLQMPEVYSIIRDNNFPSQRVARRNGMKPCGQFTKHYYGIDMPHIVFRAKRDEKLTLTAGRPDDLWGRPKQELRVYDLLDSLAIYYERVDHAAAQTMEACAAVDRILAPAVICKNLFLCNAQRTRFYLLMLRGDKKFHTKELSHQIGSARLSFAPPQYMREYLDTAPGSASVMGLMNDAENRVTLLVDEDVRKAPYVGCHPCVNTASLRLRSEDVFGRFLAAIRHPYTQVRLEA